MAMLQLGPIRLAVLDSGGAKTKTLVLPTPTKDGLDLEWIEKEATVELIDGSERTRTIGYLPQLTVKWSVYDDTAGRGYTIGTADGNRPTLESLLPLLVNNRVRISPGLTAGGFTANSIKVKPIKKRGNVYAEVSIVFRGRTATATRELEVF